LRHTDSQEEKAQATLRASRGASVPDIVVLVPAYNEEKNIAEVIRQSREFASRVLVCDDGSTDATYDISLGAGAEVIRHRCNAGYGAALRSLFLKAISFPAEAFVTIDSDGQHDSKFIPALTKSILDKEADLVIGSRFLSDRFDFTPPHRKVAIKLITRLFDLRGHSEFTDLQSGFRAYSRKALSMTCPTRTGMGASTEIMMRALKSRLKIREIPVPIYYRGEQPSAISSIIQFLDVLRSTLSSTPSNPSNMEYLYSDD
jgi:glycosyltransferase involved in cell wall biosynthesis